MNNARIDRMLRELHAEPSLQFFESLFSLTGIVMKQIAALRAKATRGQAPGLATGAAD